jgi:glutamate dehydrogenase/leucine dehydrogenase
VYKEDGFDVDELKNYIIENKGVKGHPNFIEDKEIFGKEADILVPAALE